MLPSEPMEKLHSKERHHKRIKWWYIWHPPFYWHLRPGWLEASKVWTVAFEVCRQISEKQLQRKHEATTLHFQNNTGVFGAQKGTEWYTSPNNVSDGYSLLFSLYMDAIHSQILKKMTVEEIWKSHKHFHCYILNDFAVYNKNMMEETTKAMTTSRRQDRNTRARRQ